MEEPFMTYALWGTGDIAPENAVTLLEEYIPDNVGTVYRPEVITRDQKGLRTALDWFESPDFLGAGGAVPSTDLVQSLTFDRDMQGDEVHLLALWPAVPSHEDFDFIESVQNAGITVLDLSRAMDELDLTLYSRPEPTREEKAEARAEVRKSRASKKLSDAEPVVTPEAEPPVAENSIVPPAPASDDAKNTVWLAEGMMASIKAYIDYEIARGIAAAISVPGVVEINVGLVKEDRPPFEGPYVGVDTREYFMQKSTGNWRVANGKPRRGEEVHNLTDAEAREKGIIE